MHPVLPAALPATLRPGQVPIPRCLTWASAARGAGGCPGLASDSEGRSPRRADPTGGLGPHPRDLARPKHKSTASPAAASPLRRELPGREAHAARKAAATVSDRFRSSPIADRTHLPPPTPVSHPSERGESRLAHSQPPGLRLRPAERSNTAGPRPAQPGRRAPAHANSPPEGRPPRARATPLHHATLGACPQALGLHHRVRGGAGLRRGGAPNPDVARSAPPLSSRPRSRRAPASLNFPYSVW